MHMSKNIPEQNATPITLALEEHARVLKSDKESRPPSDNVSYDQEAFFCSMLERKVNPDVCVTDDQLLDIKQFVRNNSLLHSKDSSAEGEIRMFSLATYINSIRFDCQHCLRQDCELRSDDSR